MAIHLRRWWPALLVLAGCTSAPPEPAQPGIVDRGRTWALYRGPDLVASVGHADPLRHLGDGWLILAVELQSATGSPTVARDAVSARTPDGRTLPLITQARFREGYGRRRTRIERALADLPRVLRRDDQQRPCDRWFLTGPFEGFAVDRVYLSAFSVCAGVLVFEVPGSVQPGTWRLVVELPESRADIPFTLDQVR